MIQIFRGREVIILTFLLKFLLEEVFDLFKNFRKFAKYKDFMVRIIRTRMSSIFPFIKFYDKLLCKLNDTVTEIALKDITLK